MHIDAYSTSGSYLENDNDIRPSLEDLKTLSFLLKASCPVQASLISPMMSDEGACGGDLICSYISNKNDKPPFSVTFIVAYCSCGKLQNHILNNPSVCPKPAI